MTRDEFVEVARGEGFFLLASDVCRTMGSLNVHVRIMEYLFNWTHKVTVSNYFVVVVLVILVLEPD